MYRILSFFSPKLQHLSIPKISFPCHPRCQRQPSTASGKGTEKTMMELIKDVQCVPLRPPALEYSPFNSLTWILFIPLIGEKNRLIVLLFCLGSPTDFGSNILKLKSPPFKDETLFVSCNEHNLPKLSRP